MTSQVTGGGGGSSKGHNSNKSNKFGDNCFDRNVVLNDISINILEVTSFNESNNVHLSDLTFDLSGVTRETGYYDVNKGDGVCCISCADMCTYNTDNLVNVASCVVHKLDSTDPQGTRYSDVHHTDHSVAPHVETHLAIPLITDKDTSKFVQQLACHPVTLFNTGFYDLTTNSDTWYSYIHGYPYGSPGGFYLLEILRNDGKNRIFQCDVQPESPLNVWGSLVLYIQPVTIINYHTPQDMLEARKVFDNYRQDLFIQHLWLNL